LHRPGPAAEAGGVAVGAGRGPRAGTVRFREPRADRGGGGGRAPAGAPESRRAAALRAEAGVPAARGGGALVQGDRRNDGMPAEHGPGPDALRHGGAEEIAESVWNAIGSSRRRSGSRTPRRSATILRAARAAPGTSRN